MSEYYIKKNEQNNIILIITVNLGSSNNLIVQVFLWVNLIIKFNNGWLNLAKKKNR